MIKELLSNISPLDVLFFMPVFQCIGYIVLDLYKQNKWKVLILVLLLIMYIFILPGYYIPKVSKKDSCGMPYIAITLGFWVFGGGLSIITHIVYVLLARFVKNGSKN